jgi:cyanate lyase
MDASTMTRVLLDAKKKKGLTWEALAKAAGLSEMGVASACYGENSMTSATADLLCAALDVGSEVRDALTECRARATASTARSCRPIR